MARDKVTILYKSGQKVHPTCKAFKVTWDRTNSAVTRLEYDDVQPKPLMFGLDNIEAVFGGHI